jgi:malate/lactate dehydrogenase
MQLGEVSLSLPAIINRDGIARVLSIPLNASERSALEASAKILKEQITRLESSIYTAPQAAESFHYQI